MIDLIRNSGISGLTAMTMTLALLVAIILVACQRRSRRALATLAMVAALPLLVGALGTVAGYTQIKGAMVEYQLDSAAVAPSLAGARASAYLGLGCTVLLWLICGVCSRYADAPRHHSSTR